MEKKYCLIVDDHPFTATGVRGYVEECDKSIVCVLASTAEEAINLSKQVKFDYLFADIYLGNDNGADVVGTIKQSEPNIYCVAMSATDNQFLIEKMLAAGAEGYISKRQSPELLQVAISEAIKMNRCYQVIKNEASSFSEEHILEELSPRLIEVARLLCSGVSNKQIARVLDVSEDTIKSQLKRIFQISKVSKRTEFVAIYSNALKNIQL